MHPKMVGNPLIAWREDTSLQIGWGSHSVYVESAPSRLADWLRLINGGRSRANLLESGARWGIDPADAAHLLDQLRDVGLMHETETEAGIRVAIHAGGLIAEHLGKALVDLGVVVDAAADIVVFPQGQLPCLLGAPAGAARLIPVWFDASAVHVGPVLDATRGPCIGCIDRTWAQVDAGWAALVAQASSVATWHERMQVVLAAAAIAHVADRSETVGLEMIFDPLRPGPMWRVWKVNPQCDCRPPQVREQPHQSGTTRGRATTGPGSPGTRR